MSKSKAKPKPKAKAKPVSKKPLPIIAEVTKAVAIPEPPPDRLTYKQSLFAAVYKGNATEAARLAGYEGTDATLCSVGYENLRKPEIMRAIKARSNSEFDLLILNRAERQAFWAAMMVDETISHKERLRASELLGRSEADFTERVIHDGTITLESLVTGSQKIEGSK